MSSFIIQWSGVSALIAFIALGVTVAVHMMRYAENYGVMKEKIRRLESEVADHKDVKDSVIRLEGSVNALGMTVSDFKSTLERLFTHTLIPKQK